MRSRKDAFLGEREVVIRGDEITDSLRRHEDKRDGRKNGRYKSIKGP
jgi:hypothetical protein